MVSIVLFVMVLAYYHFVFNMMAPKLPEYLAYASLTVYHLVFGMLVWSFF